MFIYYFPRFIPPLAVFFSMQSSGIPPRKFHILIILCYNSERGLKAEFWINILLWILGWIPGVIHAWCADHTPLAMSLKSANRHDCHRWIISRSEGAV